MLYYSRGYAHKSVPLPSSLRTFGAVSCLLGGILSFWGALLSLWGVSCLPGGVSCPFRAVFLPFVWGILPSWVGILSFSGGLWGGYPAFLGGILPSAGRPVRPRRSSALVGWYPGRVSCPFGVVFFPCSGVSCLPGAYPAFYGGTLWLPGGILGFLGGILLCDGGGVSCPFGMVFFPFVGGILPSWRVSRLPRGYPVLFGRSSSLVRGILPL